MLGGQASPLLDLRVRSPTLTFNIAQPVGVGVETWQPQLRTSNHKNFLDKKKDNQLLSFIKTTQSTSDLSH